MLRPRSPRGLAASGVARGALIAGALAAFGCQADNPAYRKGAGTTDVEDASDGSAPPSPFDGGPGSAADAAPPGGDTPAAAPADGPSPPGPADAGAVPDAKTPAGDTTMSLLPDGGTAVDTRPPGTDTAGAVDTAKADTAAATPTGLVARYQFEEGGGTVSADVTGNGHLMQFITTTSAVNGLPEWLSGRPGTGVEMIFFQAGRVSPSAALNNMSRAFTIGVWLNRSINHQDNDRSILGREAERGDGAVAFRLSYLEGHLHGEVGTSSVTAPGAAPAGWFHAALRFDGSTLDLFVGGTRVARGSATAATATTTFFTLGTCQVNGSYVSYADSRVDELRLYDKALSDSEVAALAQ